MKRNNSRSRRLDENYGRAVKYFAAETPLTESEIINIAARDDLVNLPAEELDVDDLSDVLARHKADILKQRQFRALNSQRRAGVIAADAIEKVAAGTFLTESQLAHIVDKNKHISLDKINESKLIQMAIDSLKKYQGRLDEGWITVGDAKGRLDEGWIEVGSKDLNEGWITVGDAKDRLDEGWITVSGRKGKSLNESKKHRFRNSRRERDLNEGWITVGKSENRLDEGWIEINQGSVSENAVNESSAEQDIFTRSLNERIGANKNHNLELSPTNRFAIPTHMV